MLHTSYKKATADTTRNVSPAIWGNLPIEDWDVMNGGYLFRDNFLNPPSIATGIITGGYGYVLASSCTIKGVSTAADIGGNLALTTSGSDNDYAYVGGSAGVGAQASIVAGGNRLAFECRLKVSSIGDDVLAWAVGLALPAMITAGGLVNDTGEIISTGSFIGFRAKNVNGGTAGLNATVDAIYQKASQTLQTNVAAVQTMVASTYVKLGFLFDPINGTPSKRIKWFVNGVEQGTYVTDTQEAAATFPDSTAMSLFLGCKAGTGTASTLTIDWWMLGQEWMN